MIKLPHLIIFFLGITLASCSQSAREDMGRNFCDGIDNCRYRCPDGTITDAHFPQCPINDRDLRPPANDNVGLEGMKK